MCESDFFSLIKNLAKKEVNALKNSLSWRITAPLRWLAQLLKKKIADNQDPPKASAVWWESASDLDLTPHGDRILAKLKQSITGKRNEHECD